MAAPNIQPTPQRQRAWSAYQASLLAHQLNPSDATALACVQACRAFCEAMAYTTGEAQKQIAVLETNLAATLPPKPNQGANPCASAA